MECETEIVYRLIGMAKIGATHKPSNDYDDDDCEDDCEESLAISCKYY